MKRIWILMVLTLLLAIAVSGCPDLRPYRLRPVKGDISEEYLMYMTKTLVERLNQIAMDGGLNPAINPEELQQRLFEFRKKDLSDMGYRIYKGGHPSKKRAQGRCR